MSKTISKGYSTSGDVASKTLPIAGYVYGTSFRVKSSTPTEAVLANITSPIDRPEKIRLAFKEVGDVYQGSGINTAYQPASKQGVQLLSQVTETWSVTDDTDPTFRVDLPLSAHLVIKIPSCEYISQDDILGLLGRLIGSLFDAGTANAWRVAELNRGVLIPKDL